MSQRAHFATAMEPDARPWPNASERGCRVQQYRFVPDSYLAAVGTKLDSGLDALIYLRLMIEEEPDRPS
jgi:hypothetical protein